MGRILVIEDEPGTQVLLKGRLHDLGHEVVMASTGAMGLMEARAQPFDLFLVDIHLGSGIDGYEVCRRIKAVPQMRSIPVVLLSGRVNSREELHRGYEAGCEAYLLKGDTNLLEDVVRAMLRIKSLQDDLALQNKLLEQRNRVREEHDQNEGLELALRGGDVRADVLRNLARSRPDGVLLVDADGIVQFADRGARDLLGQDLEGRNLGSLTPASGLEAFVRDAAHDPREGYSIELSLHRPSGTARAAAERVLSASVVPLAPHNGEVRRPLRVVLFEDVGRLRVASEMLGLPEDRFPRREMGPLLEAARSVYRPSRWIGESEPAVAVREQLEREAKTKTPVWVCGEAGSGRHFSARVLHYGGFQSGSFVPVDCRAIAPDNLETELFGQVAGAHERARVDRPGLFQLAHLGTLVLLDPEVLPAETQAAIAAAVEAGRVRRVGGKKEEAADVRLVVVSESSSDGTLAPQLMEKLAVRIDCPPLRTRIEDVAALATRFLERHSHEGRPCRMTEEALWVLEQYAWPGNVRELESCVDRAVEKAEGALVEGQHLPRPLADLYRRYEERSQIPSVPQRQRVEVATGVPASRGRYVPPPPDPLEEEPVSLELYEKHCLQRALRETGGDKLAAARLLNVGKSTLYRKLKRYGIT